MNIHTILNTQEPRITEAVGTTLLPSALEPAIALSINAETPYISPIIESFSIPADITSGSDEKSERNSGPKAKRASPTTVPTAKE